MGNDREQVDREEPATFGQVSLSRRNVLLGSTTIAVAAATLASGPATQPAKAQPTGAKPNILMIMADDIGWFNVSAYNLGVMGYRTPNIDRIAKEGALFTDWYGEQSCTAGRAAFITGQSPIRTGLTKVGLPGAPIGLHAEDMSVAEALKPLATRPANSARTILAIATNFSRPYTASTSFSATSTISTRRKSRRTRTIPRTRSFGPSLARAASSDAGPVTLTTRPLIPATAVLASR